jgi:tripartite motif-containing protein 71
VVNEAFNTITKFDANGVPSLFYADPGDESILNYPEGLAFDKAGNLYVANEDNNNIEKFDTNGVPSLFATDDGSDTILSGPEGLVFDTSSNLYVANDDGFVSKFAPAGTFLGQFGDSSYLTSPVGVAFDTNGNLYVANSLPAGDSPPSPSSMPLDSARSSPAAALITRNSSRLTPTTISMWPIPGPPTPS